MKQPNKLEFTQMIRRHSGMIHAICKMFHQNIEDQQDARQDIIIELWKSISTFQSQSKVSTWLYKVSLNTMVKRNRKPTFSVEDTSVNSVPSTNIGFADDNTVLLQQLIDHLSPHDKALTILYLEGYNHKEISQTMGISVSNVSTRIGRIKEKLKTLLNHERYATK